ncbi:MULTISPECIES: daptide-type RiPP [Streptomyces]|uniref:daptide-type RiPP n=1 Tax=Streptomyces TaxID=1883 RepID=UPI0037976775
MQESSLQEATDPVLELGLQELEAMEAPGWWSAAASAVGSAALGISVSIAT